MYNSVINADLLAGIKNLGNSAKGLVTQAINLGKATPAALSGLRGMIPSMYDIDKSAGTAVRSLMNLPSSYQSIAVGLVLLFAVYVDVRGRGSRGDD